MIQRHACIINIKITCDVKKEKLIYNGEIITNNNQFSRHENVILALKMFKKIRLNKRKNLFKKRRNIKFRKRFL